MKSLWAILVVLILLLQVRLWIGEGSFAQVWALEQSIAEQREENAELAARNDRLYAEVRNLRNEQGAVEERARMNLGLIREDETFFLASEIPGKKAHDTLRTLCRAVYEYPRSLAYRPRRRYRPAHESRMPQAIPQDQ